MNLLALKCSTCKCELLNGELGVIVAYVLVQDDSNFAVRTTDVFHRSCWNPSQGAKDAPSQTRSDHAPPPTS